MPHSLILTLILGTTLPQQESQEQLLDFVLSTERPVYYVYEPMVLNMTVINKGRQPVQGDFVFLDFEFQEFKLFYRKKGGEFKRYNNVITWLAMGSHYGPGKGPKPTVEPGSQVSKREMILFDTLPRSNEADRFVFNEPGEYEFKASFQYIYQDPSKVIESDILHITVVNPPEEEQAALALWRDKDLALVVQGNGLIKEGVRKLRVFLQKFPNSLYAAAVKSSSERLLSSLVREVKKMTEDEKELYELLRPHN